MKHPEMSVVMSVYNGERYLCNSIDSIIGQSYQDLEFVIINDGSSDGTTNILKHYNDPRIKIIWNDRTQGLTKALNKGIQMASGEYIARQDADDVSICDRLEKQANYLRRNQDISLVGTAIEIIDMEGNYLEEVEYPGTHLRICEDIKKYNCFCHGSVVFKKKCFVEIGGYREAFSSAQDYDLWLRFTAKYKVANLPDRLYKYRLNPGSLSFSKILHQQRMAMLAKQLSDSAQQDLNESILSDQVNAYLKSPIKDFERKEIMKNYYPWGKLLLTKGKKREAFLLMSEVFKYQPSIHKRWMFRMSRRLRLSCVLERLMKT